MDLHKSILCEDVCSVVQTGDIGQCLRFRKLVQLLATDSTLSYYPTTRSVLKVWILSISILRSDYGHNMLLVESDWSIGSPS